VLIAFSQILISVSAYVVAAILARGLGPALYGVYGIVYSFLQSTELMARLGVPQAVARMVARRGSRASRLEASGFTISLFVSLGVFVVFWLAAPLLADLFNIEENGAWYFRIAALDIPFYGLFFILAEILGGRRDFVGKTVGYVIYCTTKVVGIILIYLLDPTVTGALLINVAASALAVLWLVWRVGWPSLRLRLAFFRPILGLALPIAVGITGTQLLGVMDLWSLNAIGVDIKDEVKGYYVAATTLARMPLVCAFVFTAVMLPSVSRAVGMGDPGLVLDTIKGALRFLLLILVPGCILIAVEAAPVLALLFSEPYAAGAPILQVLILAHGTFNTLLFALTATLVAIEAQRVSAAIALLSVPLALLCNALLVPVFGAMGAATAALIPAVSAVAAAAFMVHRRLGPPMELSTLGRILLATLIVAVIAHFLPTQGLLVLLELAVLGVGALGLASLMGVLTVADLRPFIPARLGAKLGLAS